jgi:hypothetical protein
VTAMRQGKDGYSDVAFSVSAIDFDLHRYTSEILSPSLRVSI